MKRGPFYFMERMKGMKKYFTAAVLLLFASVAVSPASAQEIEIVDGVRLVHNIEGGKWGENLPFSIELLRTIGDVYTEDENLAFNMPSEIVLDDAGNLYILDSGNDRIQKFSPEGKYIVTFGRKGQGPGEFNSPASLDIDTKGNLYISDRGNRRIEILTPEGGLDRMIRPTKFSPSEVFALNSGLLALKGIVDFGIDSKEDTPLPKLIRLIDTEGDIKKEFGEMFDYKSPLLNQMGNRFHFVVDRNDAIYLAFDYQNRIEKYSAEGKLLWKADRPLNYSTKPLDKGNIEKTATSTSYQAPKMNKCSGGIAVDEKGRVWIITYNRQIREEEVVYTVTRGTQSGATRQVVGNTDLQDTDMYKLEIFDGDGILLGEIPLSRFADRIYIEKDHLFILDQMRGVKYFEYRIVEKE
jgi:DNA-binding beta-propeller fold protein YncE